MSEYRDFLLQQQNKKEKPVKCRTGFLRGVLVLALVVYMGYGMKNGNIQLAKYFSKEKGTELVETFGEILTSSTVGNRKLPIYKVDTKENKIALSFDAAWGADDFYKIMDVLEKHDVKVTFFMTGGWIEANPECVKELVKRGHDLGNHSEHHYDMTTISKETIREEVMKPHERVKELTGYEMSLFRPPYGAYSNQVVEGVEACGYYPIQWSVDSLDWKDYGVDSIINTVCNHKELGPGAIILCHNGAKYTADALDTMLTNLEGLGYDIVPISQLIMKEDYHMDATGKQIAD